MAGSGLDFAAECEEKLYQHRPIALAHCISHDIAVPVLILRCVGIGVILQ
jgi:hypothetical protein